MNSIFLFVFVNLLLLYQTEQLKSEIVFEHPRRRARDQIILPTRG